MDIVDNIRAIVASVKKVRRIKGKKVEARNGEERDSSCTNNKDELRGGFIYCI